MHRRLHTLVVAALAAAVALPAATAAEVLAAVAANFAAPSVRLGEAFAAHTGHVLKTASGATGKLYAQIAAGAPFEVLLAADQETPARLLAEGHAVAGTAFTYAVGRLVLWSAQPGIVDERGAVLASDRVRHLAIANPRTAPYGTAAMQVIEACGLTRRLRPKLVTGESIAQTFQFVASGNAELGFVARSQLAQLALPGGRAGGSSWLVPQDLHAPLRQDAVLLRAGEHNPAARALLAFLQTEPARRVMRDFGYEP